MRLQKLFSKDRSFVDDNVLNQVRCCCSVASRFSNLFGEQRCNQLRALYKHLRAQRPRTEAA